MSIESPENRDELIEHCLMLIGQPVIRVNVSIDQCRLVVKQAVKKFAEYHYEGHERLWLRHQIDQNFINNKFLTVPDDVIEVTDVLGIDNSVYGIFDKSSAYNHLFSGMTQSILTSSDKISVYLYERDLSEFKNLFNPPEIYRFSNTTKRLFIDVEDWDLTIGQYLVYQGVVSLENITPKFWSNDWLIRYSAALIKKQWGANMSKFTEVTLPGGYTMSGSEIKSDAKEEIDALLTELYENNNLSQIQISFG